MNAVALRAISCEREGRTQSCKDLAGERISLRWVRKRDSHHELVVNSPA
eukprot:CAMPEP_0180679790 /NCGR_PEP_ID=MMETSP1037_2-20121125/69111_1 /TAXON_ID=632150 /ORGANISM="Azadinium spinosum, Strain 3D9" /LENGTH=48 /DNA_ID= /DNA_START= /DNA_END= /DNA_ORIENTATION=